MTCRQNGNAANGWQDEGTCLYLHSIKVTGDGAVTNAFVGFRGAKTSGEMTAGQVTAGVWTDVFGTFAQNADNTQYTVTLSVCPTPASGKPDLTTQTLTPSKALALSFNSGNLTLGGYHDSAASASTTRSFRGVIADFMIWERALTEEEKYEVMAGRHGAKWTVGAVNGSADEFNDGANASVAVADPYLPESQPWNRMRKTLDAAHPTLTLLSPLSAAEAGKPMILTVTPLLSGTAATCPLRVSVNGETVGTAHLVSGVPSNVLIPKTRWTRDADGHVTVALTRTETTGTVAIDALALSGSWQSASANGGTDGMTSEKTAARYAFAGDSDQSHFTSSASLGNSSTNYTFGVWVPAGAGAKCGWRFSTKTTGNVDNTVQLAERHALLVNGETVAEHTGMFAKNEAFDVDLPAGTLHDGMNYVQWVQTAPRRDGDGFVVGKGGIYQHYDFWGMTLVPPPIGTVLLVR